MTKNQLREFASDYFYKWEDKNYPDGSPFSDEDRWMFIDGWVEGYLFLNSQGD